MQQYDTTLVVKKLFFGQDESGTFAPTSWFKGLAWGNDQKNKAIVIP